MDLKDAYTAILQGIGEDIGESIREGIGEGILERRHIRELLEKA